MEFHVIVNNRVRCKKANSMHERENLSRLQPQSFEEVWSPHVTSRLDLKVCFIIVGLLPFLSSITLSLLSLYYALSTKAKRPESSITVPESIMIQNHGSSPSASSRSFVVLTIFQNIPWIGCP